MVVDWVKEKSLNELVNDEYDIDKEDKVFARIIIRFIVGRMFWNMAG